MSNNFIQEGIARFRRLKIASLIKSTQQERISRAQEANQGFFRNIVSKVTKGFLPDESGLQQYASSKEELQSAKEKVQGNLRQLSAAQNVALDKVKRSQNKRWETKDISSSANRLRAIVGLHSAIAKHQEALQQTQDPTTLTTLVRKIKKAHQNIERFS